jgi:hypothetical protein
MVGSPAIWPAFAILTVISYKVNIWARPICHDSSL